MNKSKDMKEDLRTPQEKLANEDQLMSWRFWFLVVLSILLFITFVLYLPLRFRYQSLISDDHTMVQEETDHGHTPEEAELPHGH